MQGGPRTAMAHTAQPHSAHPSYEGHFQHITLSNGQVLSFDQMDMDEPARSFVEQHNRLQQQQASQAPVRNGKIEAQRALGVAAQPGQQVPVHQRPMIAQNGQGVGQYYVDAQGRPVQVNGWQVNAQQQMRAQNGQFTPAQMQQQQQILQQQYAQQQSAQQHLFAAQQRGSQPPSARPPPHQAGQSPVMLQVPPPPSKQRIVSRAASRSPSPIPPHLRPPINTISQPLQSTTSAMPTTGSNPTLLPVRASTLPAPSVQQPVPTSNHYNTFDFAAGPSKSAPASSKPHATGDAGRYSEKHYRREARLSAVARARKKEDKTTRLRRHIEQAQAQLEAVTKQEEEASEVQAVGEGSALVDMQGTFNDLILEYLERAGFTSSVNAFRGDIARHPQASPKQDGTSSSKTSPEGTVADTGLRSPRDESSTGDATLVECSSGDISLDGKHSLGASPVKTSSPVKSITTATSPFPGSRVSNMGKVAADSPVVRSRARNLQSVDEEGDFPADLTGRDAQADGVSLMVVDEKPDASSREEATNTHEKKVLPTIAKGEKEDTTPVDPGYLYTWWTVFEDTQRLVKQKLLRSRDHSPRQAPIPNTAMQPTSAMATRIAVSAPAAAVRASSVDANGQRTAALLRATPTNQTVQARHALPGNVQGNEPPPTAVTAQLQAADRMRRAQQAHIDAQQEEYKRRQMNANAGFGIHPAIPNGQRQAMMTANGTQLLMTNEEVQRHMATQHNMYQQQYPHLQSQQAQQMAQANVSFSVGTPNGAMRQYQTMHPQALLQHGSDSGSPSTDNGVAQKRPAESPSDGPTKKRRMVGKRPTPEDHQRQALEIAARATQQMPAPTSIPQMPPGGQMQFSRGPGPVQNTPRSISDAERQYSMEQMAYIRQQVANSPSNQITMSPAHIVEPTLMNIMQSPSVVQSGFEVGLNATPTSTKPKKSKQTPSLVLDIESAVDRPEITPPSATSTKRKQPRKASARGGTGQCRGRGGKSGRGRASISDAATPPGATPSYSVTVTPTGPSSAQYGEPSSVPQSSHSISFHLPSSGMDHHLPDRYAEDHQRQQQEQQVQPGRRNTNGMPHLNGSQQDQPAAQPGQQGAMEQQGAPHHASHASAQHHPNSAPSNDHMADDFLKALNSFGQEGGTASHPPNSAFQGTFDDSAFDFDWATANFGGDENQEWAHLDPAPQEGGA